MNKKKIYDKIYNLKNKEKIKKRKKEYYLENREKILKYRKDNGKHFIKIANIRRQKCYESWIGYFPETTKCQVCGKKVHFYKKDYRIAIHFDHRNEGKELIKGHPSQFLYTRYRNEKNQKKWEQCDFGMLCRRCNLLLPTKNRKEHLKQMVKYAFGKELI